MCTTWIDVNLNIVCFCYWGEGLVQGVSSKVSSAEGYKSVDKLPFCCLQIPHSLWDIGRNVPLSDEIPTMRHAWWCQRFAPRRKATILTHWQLSMAHRILETLAKSCLCALISSMCLLLWFTQAYSCFPEWETSTQQGRKWKKGVRQVHANPQFW